MAFAAAQTMWMPMHPGLGQGVGLGLNMSTAGAAPPSSTELPAPSRSPPASWSTKSPSLLRQELDSPRPWTPDDHAFLEAPFGLAAPTNKIKRIPAIRRQPSYQLPYWNGFQNFHLDAPNHTFLESARSSSIVHLSAGTTFFFSARTSVASDCKESSAATPTVNDAPAVPNCNSLDDDDDDDDDTDDKDDNDDENGSGSDYSSVIDLDIDPDLLNILSFEGSSMTAGARADRHMAVSARPKTARDYQRYRSQWTGDAANLSTTAAILSKYGQNGLCDFYAPTIGRKRASPSVSRKTSMSRTASLSKPNQSEKRKMEPPGHIASEQRGTRSATSTAPNTPRKVYAAPSCSSPSLMTRQEFEALPPAIQRKYFSSLERLRFAQSSGHQLDDLTPEASDDLLDGNQALKRRKTKRSIRRSRTLSVDSGYFASLPDKVQRTLLTPEERRIAARSRRQSVMLDAADEAIYKIGRRASRVLTPDDLSSLGTLSLPSSPRRASMDSAMATSKPAHFLEKDVPNSFFESFRWLDEDEDLDLRLSLDDYNFNRENSTKPSKPRGPSFRRHLSISKIHLPRPSLSQSSTRPGTKDTSVTPATPVHPASPLSNLPNHARRRSRALSLMTSKPSMSENTDRVGPIDAAAAHYQDPEARLKLRVYLASPQKFDEAIEFGFPSNDVLSAKPLPELKPPKRRQSRQTPTDDEILRTFLSDDKSSIYSEGDDASAPDPDSPKTPETMDKPSALMRPLRLNTEPVLMPKASGEYAQAPASAREMTLRMTLTRPDLRAGEEQIYGWQKSVVSPARRSQSTTLRDELSPVVTYIRDGGNSKDSIERQFAALDQWEQDRGVVKRIWNRVRRN